MDLFYPEQSVVVGDYTITRGIDTVVCSSRDDPYDWARITFTPEFNGEITLPKGAAASVSMGYGGQLVPIFSGTVSEDFSSTGEANSLLLRDSSIVLQRTPINLVFTSVTPQEIVAHCCREAGIAEVLLSDEQYVQRAMVPMLETDALSAIRSIGSIWRIAVSSYFVGDTFVWGAPLKQQEQLKLEHGVNIISLKRVQPFWELETVSLPFLRHSQSIVVDHPLVSGAQLVSKVIFRSDAKGFIRTFVYF